MSMESTYLPHLPNSNYIEKDTYFLWRNFLTTGSCPENWRIWTDAEYIPKSTPSPTSTMGMANTLTRVTMMTNNMNFVKPTTHGLIKDNQDQKNENCGVSKSENTSQVIITQPIFTNLVNGKITAKTIGHDSIISNWISFSLKVSPASSGKSITNYTHKEE